MADELNIPTHRWYEPRNNIRLAKEDFSKQWIYDSGIQKIDAWINSQPWGNPATTLFSVAGSLGFFYDFSDYTTQFTDVTGTSGVTGVGQSLALVLDESQGLVRGPELVTNGDFSSPTGWTLQTGWTIGGGVLDGNVAAAAFANAGTAVSLVAGRSYQITFTITSYTSGAVRSRISGGTDVFSTTDRSSVGTFTDILVAVAGNNTINMQARSAGFVGTIDNVSVREIPGNHATQATAGNRPLTQVRPMFTQRNRAVGSELPGNNFYWLQSPFVNGGVTITPLASGIDPSDGLPFYEFRAQGTPSATSVGFVAANVSNWAIPAVQGQVVTTSATLQRTGGTTAGVTSFRLAIEEQNNLNVTTAFEATSDFTGTDPTVISRTRTLTNAATVRVVSYPYLAVVIGVPVDVTFRIKAFQFELGSARTTYQPAVSGELRNRAIGSGAVDNATYWPNTSTVNGVTSTKVASGFDADGLPYVDVRYQGTATATFQDGAYNGNPSRSPASIGQGWTGSVTVRRIGGFTTGVTGLTVSTVEETAPFTFIGQAAPAGTTATTDTFLFATRTIASGNQVRTAMVLEVTNGATIDVTYRIKGLQLEQNATYSRYQRTITANEWYEPGFTSYRGIAFDGTDDFLQTQAINFPAAESLGPELVTNGDFSSGTTTGWAPQSGATLSIVSGAMRVLDDGVDAAAARAYQVITTVVGRTYKLSGAVIAGSTTSGIFAASPNTSFFGQPQTAVAAGTSGSLIFTATTTSTNIILATNSLTAGIYADFDNVSVKEVLFAADKMTVVAGVRKLSDAAQGVLVELSTSALANVGSFVVTAPENTVGSLYGALSRGSAAASGTQRADVSGAGAAPDAAVLAVQFDIVGDTSTIRRNNGATVTASGDQGTGNYGNYPVYIGRRGGTTLPFNGILTFLCVINRVLTAAELAQLEAFANSRTGAYT